MHYTRLRCIQRAPRCQRPQAPVEWGAGSTAAAQGVRALVANSCRAKRKTVPIFSKMGSTWSNVEGHLRCDAGGSWWWCDWWQAASRWRPTAAERQRPAGGRPWHAAVAPHPTGPLHDTDGPCERAVGCRLPPPPHLLHRRREGGGVYGLSGALQSYERLGHAGEPQLLLLSLGGHVQGPLPCPPLDVLGRSAR